MNEANSSTIADAPPEYSALFNRLARGMTTRAILAADKLLRPETIAAARAFLNASNPEEYARIANLKPRPRYKILLDENVSHRAAALISAQIYDVFTIRALGKCGISDREVADFAKKEGFDAIVSGDRTQKNAARDLTPIVVGDGLNIFKRAQAAGLERANFPEVPLLIQLKPQQNGKDKVGDLFQQYDSAIRFYIESMHVPYILLDTESVRPSKTFNELANDEAKRIQLGQRTKFARQTGKQHDASQPMPIEVAELKSWRDDYNDQAISHVLAVRGIKPAPISVPA